MSSYEGSSQTVNNSFPLHAIKKSGYSYAPRGLPKFTGQQLDATGLQHYQSRYYDPRDPIGRGTFVSAAWGNRNTFYQSKNGIELCSLNPVYFLPFVGCRCRQVGPQTPPTYGVERGSATPALPR